ncbi:uncharacterized protein K452DRAFT_360953 [Aplosporella prunicola CBS 121167]|uniref:Cytoplasmic tRNA 2-thiolation protein 2 n=1 Tax=Aplosporella prunicola CBS 121167 TaxID=1176127 RepID=A0A6A6B610_9PEZI|nr:uncharacterized protein K452DRAFT_360953 [Aplosporella prunicola CBS 121167]KAF2138715.1 hypothetical protein K452DRAFT_360953 [Aplosporella prunicola CBS 121167]
MQPARLCQRCRQADATVLARSQHLCKDCFTAYIQMKAVKRMESYAYQVRFNSAEQRTLLLPLSLGVSSTVLLQSLHIHLDRQKSKTGRTGYALHILFVDTSAVEPDTPDAGRLEALKERFPGHAFSSILLADIFDNSEPRELLDIPEAHFLKAEDLLKSPQEKLEKLIVSLPSATARADVITILRTKLITRFAQQNGCEAVLWGDSTTRIAEKTLAETSKGRGFSLPWQVADGMSPYGIAFNYPMRDLLKKELTLHAELTSPSLTPLIHTQAAVQVSASAKNTTIDDLMKQYFQEVEQNYPGIVANVVRTSSKLEAASVTESRCSLCSMPVADARFGIHGWGGDQGGNGAPDVSRSAQEHLCYGCTRSAPQAAGSLQ